LSLIVVTAVKAAVPTQVALSGPNRLKVIVPVGLKPPNSVAVSLMVPPRVMGPDACDTIVVTAGLTSTLSFAAPHALVTGLLPPSPE
jgi:hypothetical protein